MMNENVSQVITEILIMARKLQEEIQCWQREGEEIFESLFRIGEGYTHGNERNLSVTMRKSAT
jgi:hypothetical protein